VDEVAALHAEADCVVHFGRSCLSPVSRLPSRLVFAKRAVDVDHLAPLLADVRCAARTHSHPPNQTPR
jgi:diphthamide biosynthesis protein 2